MSSHEKIQILNSPLIISCWILLVASCLSLIGITLRGSNMLCILLAYKMCTFEILSPRIDIVDYLVPRWHVSSTSCNLLVYGVKMMLDIFSIYHRQLFPNTSCLLTIDTQLGGRNY